MYYFIAGSAGLAAVLAVLGVFLPNHTVNVSQRMERLVGHVEVPRERSLAERTFVPLLHQLRKKLVASTPQGLAGGVRTRIDAAGLDVAPEQFIVIWAALAVSAPLGCLVLLISSGLPAMRELLMMGAFCGICGAGPWIYLGGRAKERMAKIDRSLPDVVDLIVTNIESGLALQAAMMNVAERFPGAVAAEFGRVIRETSVGRPRDEAIQAMAERVASKDLTAFSRAITQAERTGIPIGKVLRSQATEIRRRRRQLAREKAGKLPVKMTILTVLFMFPTLFMLLLGPVVMQIMDAF